MQERQRVRRQTAEQEGLQSENSWKIIPKGNTNPSIKVWERLNKEGEAIERHATASAETKLMQAIIFGLCALSLLAGLAPKVAAQNVTITVGPATDDSYWVWNDDYQCWLWTGPEFQGDYQVHRSNERNIFAGSQLRGETWQKFRVIRI